MAARARAAEQATERAEKRADSKQECRYGEKRGSAGQQNTTGGRKEAVCHPECTAWRSAAALVRRHAMNLRQRVSVCVAWQRREQ